MPWAETISLYFWRAALETCGVCRVAATFLKIWRRNDASLHLPFGKKYYFSFIYHSRMLQPLKSSYCVVFENMDAISKNALSLIVRETERSWSKKKSFISQDTFFFLFYHYNLFVLFFSVYQITANITYLRERGHSNNDANIY